MIDFAEDVTLIKPGVKTYDPDLMTDIVTDDVAETIQGSVQVASANDAERLRVTLDGRKIAGVHMIMYTEEYTPLNSVIKYSNGPLNYKLNVVNISPYVGWDDELEHYKVDLLGSISDE